MHKKVAILCSGNGSNLQAIINAVKKGFIKAEIVLVLSDNKSAFALQRAKKAGIKNIIVNPGNFADRVSYDKEITKILKNHKVDLVVLAGFMRILSPCFINSFKNKIMNVHPSLLPLFKGAHAVRDALESCAKITGVTIHFVTIKLDAGPVILQEVVEIKKSDTEKSLLNRIHKVEHLLYPKAIKLFLEGKLKIKNNKVISKPSNC